MKLIGSLSSPFVRKARIVLAEKKIDYEFELDLPWEPDSRIVESNPLGKVPALILDDNTVLYDSRVIVEYVDSVTPNNRMLPASGRERILVKRWEALGDGICDAAANIVIESRRIAKERSKQWIERQYGKIERGITVAAKDLGEQAWCHSNAMTLADISIGVTLAYLDFRLSDLEWRTAYPNLVRLYDKLMQRQSFAETVPQG